MLEKIKKVTTNFLIGIAILMLSYIMLYLMGGKEEYLLEISNLQNIKNLIIQCVGSGIFYILFFKILEYINVIISPKIIKEITYADMFKYIGILLLGLPIAGIIFCFFKLPDNVKMVYYFNAIMLLIILSIISTVDQYNDVKKINQVLKDKNDSKENK